MSDSKETTLEFIEDYKARRLLWDTKHPSYQDNTMRRAALQDLVEKYNIPLNAVKNKIKNLRSYFCKEQQKVVSGVETTWFAYKALSFLWEVSILATREDRQSTTSETTPAIKIELEEDNDEDSEDQTETVEFLVLDENTSKKRKLDVVQEVAPDPIQVQKEIRQCINKPDDHQDRREEVSDEYSLFGEYITKKLRKLNARNKVVAQNRISNILLQLEMDEIVETSTSGVEWSTI
ncbi:uncharacterized protein LOC128679146 isoform X2 [Plodia interpunctella]|uniref:uncharacterized protein LOC128679146 isoform X2 n=1 Tax=Plodia interpunctella TaxID=58824 RepID=UPI0023685D69|nr:uncharacterized protein LOC128679146 isoform X2 [Plodia interpunctella]